MANPSPRKKAVADLAGLLNNFETSLDLVKKYGEQIRKAIDQEVKARLEENAELRQGNKANPTHTGPSINRRS